MLGSLTLYMHHCAIPKLADVRWWEDGLYSAAIKVSVLSPQPEDGQVHSACVHSSSAVDSTSCFYVRV